MPRPYDDVNVIGAGIECMQIPVTVPTDAPHCFVNHLSMACPKAHWGMPKLTLPPLVDRRVSWEKRLAELIVVGICTPALVTMQPRAIASECDEIGERIPVRVSDRHGRLLRQVDHHTDIQTRRSDMSGKP